MADTRLSDLSAAAALSATDLFYAVQSAGAGGVKATGTQLLTLVGTTYLPLTGGTLTGRLTITQGTANTAALASTGYSLTGSDATSMVDLAGTWNTSGSPTAIKLNVTNTASGAASLLMDLQVGGVSKCYVTKSGASSWAGEMLLGTNIQISFNAVSRLTQGSASGLLRLLNGASTASLYFGNESVSHVFAIRDAANQQIARIYNTWTDASNFERLTLTGVAGTSVNITAETAGTGGDNLDIKLTPAGTGGVNVGTNYITATEMTAPAAAAANSVRIYAQDNGAGKTQLMAIFASGAAQQIAIEP